MIADRDNMITMLRDGSVSMPRMEGYYLSVFSYTPCCEGVTLPGVKYPLQKARLTNWTTLGLSNEILAETAQIAVEKGTLVVVLSRDRRR